MTASVAEYSAGNVRVGTDVLGSPIVSYLSLSTATGSTGQLINAATDYIRVLSDTACLAGFTASTVSTAAVLSSTNAVRIAANVAEKLAVPKGTSSTGGAFRFLTGPTT